MTDADNTGSFKTDLLQTLDEFQERVAEPSEKSDSSAVDYIKAAELLDSMVAEYSKNVDHVEELGKVMTRNLD